MTKKQEPRKPEQPVQFTGHGIYDARGNRIRREWGWPLNAVGCSQDSGKRNIMSRSSDDGVIEQS